MSSNKNFDIAISVSIIESPSNYAFGDTMALLSLWGKSCKFGNLPIVYVYHFIGKYTNILFVRGVVFDGENFLLGGKFPG